MKDDLVETLLRHDVDERLPPEHERRIREGLGALLAPPLQADPPKADPPKVEPPKVDPPSPSPPPLADVATPSALGKLLTTGLLVLGGAGAGFVAGRATAPASVPAVAVTAAPSGPTLAAPATASAPLATDPPASAPSTAPAAAGAPSASAAPQAAVRASSSTDAFDREQSLLERARSALVRHDAAAAEQALDECERQFPRARHAEERDYLRIQTLRERGDTARVRERAQAFLAKYPTSLLRARVEPLAE
ncbi:MAG TPA: outer membrane protein assembly factor BamD [Labilithrix sp.]|nr:outer membrane protein assembly factor BamD [Labilithrix sp.]